MMKLLTYTYHGLMDHSKCPDCREWTPIKELKTWSGLCQSCYMKRQNMTTESDTKRKKNLCSDCRDAEFDEEDRPYCIISEPVECTENVESCESYDPISSIIKHRKRSI